MRIWCAAVLKTTSLYRTGGSNGETFAAMSKVERPYFPIIYVRG